MIVDVEMPRQGLTITEATLIRWSKRPGDAVTQDEPLFQMETDKALVEVESPATGLLLAILAAEGDVVPLGQVVARIATEAADEEKQEDTPRAAPEDRRPVVSPRARRVAEQLGVDLGLVQPTGRRGKHIRERDVLLAAQQQPKPQPEVSQTGRLRGPTARHTAASFRDVPHFYLTREISAERLLVFRSEIVEGIEAQAGVRLTVTDLLLRALAVALAAFPGVNAQWNGSGVTPLASVDVGLAVDTPEGLIVPVIRQADTLSLVGIARQRSELVGRAREGRSNPQDLGGGSFTLSNLGAAGVDQFAAIINAPQSGILSAGAIKQRPYVVSGVLGAVHTLILTVSMDHRVVDGSEAARFLATVTGFLENPALMCAF